MERVRAKFNVSPVCKDKNGNAIITLWAVYKGDESSPENESFSNSTPSGNVVMYVTNPAAIEFFSGLENKYVYLDFTPYDPVPPNSPNPDGNAPPSDGPPGGNDGDPGTGGNG